MNRIRSTLPVLAAGLLLTLAAGSASADRGGDAAARFLRPAMATAAHDAMKMSRDEFLQMAGQAWDEQARRMNLQGSTMSARDVQEVLMYLRAGS